MLLTDVARTPSNWRAFTFPFPRHGIQKNAGTADGRPSKTVVKGYWLARVFLFGKWSQIRLHVPGRDGRGRVKKLVNRTK